MGKTTDEIVQGRAKACACGRMPVWARVKGGAVILACPTISCKLYLAVRRHTLSDAIEAWNKEVDLHEQRAGERH